MLPPIRHLLAVLAVAAFGGAVAAPASAQQPAPTTFPVQTVEVRGATLGYRDINPTASGTPLVLIAGYGLTMTEWDPTFVMTLAQNRRVITFDNRGIGRSSGPVRGLTVRSMARDTAGLIRALGLGRVDVLGWSMGGYIAQQLAISSPQLVNRLILAATDPGSPHAIQPTQRVVDILTSPSTTPTDLLPILFPADQQAAGQAWMAAISAQPNLTAADFSTPPATMAAQSRATGRRWYGRGHGTYRNLPRIKAPTLVAHGTEDVIVPPGNARLLARRIPNVTRRTYRDAGHAFLFQDPAAKAQAFAAFLSG
jgi:pimeloyl-ACP methyl ester carboxylesterase